jgi:hypothetical protein
MDLAEGWSHVVRGGRVVKAKTPSSTTTSTPHPVTEAPEQPNVTATTKTAKPKKPVPKSTAATKAVTVKPNKKAPAVVKTVAANPKTINLVVTPQLPTSDFEDISDLLDNLLLQARLELTRRLLTSNPALPLRGSPS